MACGRPVDRGGRRRARPSCSAATAPRACSCRRPTSTRWRRRSAGCSARARPARRRSATAARRRIEERVSDRPHDRRVRARARRGRRRRWMTSAGSRPTPTRRWWSPELRRRGLAVATEGERPARVCVRDVRPGGRGRMAVRPGARRATGGLPLGPPAAGHGARPARSGLVAGADGSSGCPGRGAGTAGGAATTAGFATSPRGPTRCGCRARSPRETVAERFGVAAERVPYCYDSAALSSRRPRAPGPNRRCCSPCPGSGLTRIRRRCCTRPPRWADRYRCVSSGAARTQAALEALAERLGVRCSVETAADDAAVDRAYHEAAVAVCPSRFEGFGLTPVEAVASGVPVVASDIPPHREFVGAARAARSRSTTSTRSGRRDRRRPRRAAAPIPRSCASSRSLPPPTRFLALLAAIPAVD